jgi:hypothetical protein
MNSLTDMAFERFYYGRKNFVNGTTEFHSMIASQVVGSTEILEIGSGPTNCTSDFLGTLGNLVGLDVSDEVKQNRALRRAFVYDGGILPFKA